MKLNSSHHFLSNNDNYNIINNNNPLFNAIISFYIIIYLYLPIFFHNLIISPILISTLILLLLILRLGTSQQQSFRLELETQLITTELELESNIKIDPTKTQPESNSTTLQTNEPSPAQQHKAQYDSVEWTVWGPLEVIYEAYDEGEDGEDETQNDTSSLLRYYPESESDIGSDTDMDTNSSYSLDGDFLEIALDYENCNNNNNKRGNLVNKLSNKEIDEEDNLIEIDISPNNNNNNCEFEFSW